MTTFTLSADTVRSLATLTNAASTDSVTPVIQAIQLTVTPSSWIAVATDRYVVAELTGDMGDWVHTLPAEPFSVLIKATDLADFAKRMGARAERPVNLTVTDDGTELEMNNWDVRAIYRTISGNYPPVERLFPDADKLTDMGALAFAPDMLARLGKIYTPLDMSMAAKHRRELPVHLQFTESSGKPGPVLITRGLKAVGYRALLQPRLILN